MEGNECKNPALSNCSKIKVWDSTSCSWAFSGKYLIQYASQHFGQIPHDLSHSFVLCFISCFSDICLLIFYYFSKAK